MSLQTHVLAVRQPISVGVATRTLALTTTDGSVTLPAGGYELVLGASSDLAVIGLGTTTTALPDASEDANIAVIPSLGVAELALDAETVLHARMLSGTATLYIVRKAAG